MKLTSKTKIIVAAIAACAASINMASADIIPFPDLSGGGDFTLADTNQTIMVAAGSVNIADQATSVVTINGSWVADADTEIQLGGVNYHAIQDVTLNIGPVGSVTWSKGWIGDGPGGGGTVEINIAAGGVWSYVAAGQFLRWHPSGFSQVDGTNLETAFDEGILNRDGASGGTFAENFSFSDDGGGSWTLTAIPEPGTLGLVGMFGGLLLAFRRRTAA